MINPKIIGVILIVTAGVLIGITIPSQYVTASFCTNMLSEDADVDVAEGVEAGNATTMMMTNQSANGNMTGVEFLSIQSAQSGSLSQINATAYTLELNEIANETILFSDRPERVVTSVSTSDFVGNWTNAPDSFAADAPNAALIIEEIQTGKLDTDVIELFNPVYDSNANSLTYTIMTENTTSTKLPNEFERSTLVIDRKPIAIQVGINDISIIAAKGGK